MVVEPGAVVGLGALAMLTEQGYERMTVDIVHARAKMARATVYRRRATNGDLVTWIIDVANAG